MITGLRRHFSLTLRLNFRSPQAIAYGYLMPALFLVGFAAVFRSDTPPLRHEMGQLLTITLLGGACFGLPTALVAERERGVWRRYRLLPVGTGWLLVSTLLARLVLVATAALLQIVLAWVIYRTPLPAHPLQLGVAFLVVTGAFLGWGLIVAALAPDVPAVQALGQCVFLPMILIGGVGVPIAVLPIWAQHVSGFMPGRYAVEVLQACVASGPGLRDAGFGLLALSVIGMAAYTAGIKLFRWEADRRMKPEGRAWLALALLAWLAVGLAASLTGRLQSRPALVGWEAVTDDQIVAITYTNLPADSDIVTPLSPPFERDPGAGRRIAEFAAQLESWPLAHTGDALKDVRNLLCVASIADVSEDPRESEIARAVFNQLRADHDRAVLRRALAWIILNPKDGALVLDARDLGLRRHPPEWAIRNRNELYARKLLGRLLGRIAD